MATGDFPVYICSGCGNGVYTAMCTWCADARTIKDSVQRTTQDRIEAQYIQKMKEMEQLAKGIREKNKEPSLKLFVVTVYVTGASGAPNGYRTYILDVDGPSAENKVLDLLGRHKINPDRMVDTDEIKGPFAPGHIIVWDEF